jgi:GDP-4-dehydro-6-deoxy-D-mannose reductase
MVRILITGASGFAGTHLIQALREEGKSQYDIYGTCFPDLPSPSEKKLFFLDIRSQKDLKSIISDIKPDWVFHLAAVSNVRRSWEKRTETIEINIIGTHNLLEAIRTFSPRARVLFVSSSEVYRFDRKSRRPVTEKSPVDILSPYAYSKVAGEILCEFYVRVEKLDVVIARPFPHTGPGQSEEFVCSDWAKQIAEIEKGKKPPVIQVGNLDVTSDYCDVRDVVKAYILLLKKGKGGEVYNICTGRAISLRKILDIMIKEADIKKTIKIKTDQAKLRKLDLPVRLGKNNKIKNEVGWKPEIPIGQTLRDLLAWWRKKCNLAG